MIVKVKNPLSIFRRKLVFRFDIWAWFKMCELSGIEIHEMDKLTADQKAMAWIYAAYLSHCANVYQKPKYGYRFFDKFYRHLYVNDYQTLQLLTKTMIQTQFMGKSLEQHAKDDEKKK
jgi:hypothetical protein